MLERGERASRGASGTALHAGIPPPLTTPHCCTPPTRCRVQPPPGAAASGLSGTYAIVRRFEFSAEKQRNVVVVRKPDGSLHVMAKGSPEMMRKLAGARLGVLPCWPAGWAGQERAGSRHAGGLPVYFWRRRLPAGRRLLAGRSAAGCLCLPLSLLHPTLTSPPGLTRPPCPPPGVSSPAAPASVPSDFDAELGRYTREGLRVLGLATRPLAGLSEGEVQGMAQVRRRGEGWRQHWVALLAVPLEQGRHVAPAEPRSTCSF